jgi:hypothetical protein
MFWFDEVDYGVPSGTFQKGLKKMNSNTPGTIFIALSGKKQVGKDTAAGMIMRLCESQGKRVVLTAFAESLKRMCVEILGLQPEGVNGTDEQKNALCHILWDGFPAEARLKYSNSGIVAGDGVYDADPRSGPMTNREVLQVMGTDVFRAIYGNVWAKAPFNRDWSAADVVILTDCRFPNEKLVTEEAGGVIIRLERSTGLSDNHASEIALDGYSFDNTYQNNGSFEDLNNYIKQVLKKYSIINEQ